MDYGSVEGVLESWGLGPSFRVRDALYPNPVLCAVSDALRDKVAGCVNRRVEIEGRIGYLDGVPISIFVQSIEICPSDDDLPTAEDVRGIMPSSKSYFNGRVAATVRAVLEAHIPGIDIAEILVARRRGGRFGDEGWNLWLSVLLTGAQNLDPKLTMSLYRTLHPAIRAIGEVGYPLVSYIDIGEIDDAGRAALLREDSEWDYEYIKGGR